MEKEAAIAQASEKTAKKKWVKVQIYTPTHILTGSAYCPQQRLLDVLNGILAGTMRTDAEFLPVSEAEIRSPDGKETSVKSVHINKTNILFLKGIGDGHRGLGGEVGHKPYPFVLKSSTAVRLYMPSYTLTGQVHYAKGKGIADVLNSGLRFFPVTNVEISSSVGSEPGVSFIAVNKGQILYLEELEPSQSGE